MHISEGVLSPEILMAGGVLSAGGILLGIKQIEPEDIPTVALLTAAFFLASLVHVPIGVSNVHLVLNGLVGLMLGIRAFPAIFIALSLQAVLFQFGGLTTLGINTLNMALPGIAIGVVARKFMASYPSNKCVLVAWLVGFLSILGSGLMVALSLFLSGKGFLAAAKLIFVAHIPVAIVEGFVTAGVVSFLSKVKPELLGINRWR